MHVFIVTGSGNAGKSSLIRALTGVREVADWSVGVVPNGANLPLIVFTTSLGEEHRIGPSEFVADLQNRMIRGVPGRNERHFQQATTHLLLPLRTDKHIGHPLHANAFLAAFQHAGWSIQNPIIHVQTHATDLFNPVGHLVTNVPGNGLFGPNGWQVRQAGAAAHRVPANVRAAIARAAWGWQ